MTTAVDNSSMSSRNAGSPVASSLQLSRPFFRPATRSRCPDVSGYRSRHIEPRLPRRDGRRGLGGVLFSLTRVGASYSCLRTDTRVR